MKCPNCHAEKEFIFNEKTESIFCFNCSLNVKICPNCTEMSLTHTFPDEYYICICGYVEKFPSNEELTEDISKSIEILRSIDPNLDQILKDIQDEQTGDLLYDIDIESIFKIGIERIDSYRRQSSQLRMNTLLHIGEYSLDFNIN